jgi:hypothetical protein
MKKILTMLFLACGIAAMPLAYAVDEAPKDQKGEQKATGDKKDGKDGKAGEPGEKKEEKKGGGGAEPECS